MKRLLLLSILVSSIFGAGINIPYGNVKVFENTPYIIVSNQEIISKVFKQIALTASGIDTKVGSVLIDADHVNTVKDMALSYRSMMGDTKIYPLVSSEEVYKNVLGFWPGKEIVCEVVSLNRDNHQIFMNIDQIYIYQEKLLDLILVKCKPISDSDINIIKSSRDNSIACLGAFRKQLSKYSQPLDETIPAIVSQKFKELESEYFSKTEIPAYESYQRELLALRGMITRGGGSDPLYIGTFSISGKNGRGYLALLNARGELLEIKEGYSRLLGIYDLDKDGLNEVLVFWGSGYGGGVELLEINAMKYENIMLQSLHRLTTVWD